MWVHVTQYIILSFNNKRETTWHAIKQGETVETKWERGSNSDERDFGIIRPAIYNNYEKYAMDINGKSRQYERIDGN